MSRKPFLVRFFKYLSERFDLLQMSILAVVFGTASVFNYENYGFVYSSIALFLILLQLRLTDEFKDYKHDKKFYPERPVPRGLVTLGELKPVLFAVIVAEIVVLFLGKGNIALFIVLGIYRLFIAKEFFVPDWLKRRFTLYIVSHELSVIPLFSYLSLFGIKPGSETLSTILFNSLFLGINLFCLEIVRKFRTQRGYVGKDTYIENYGLTGSKLLLAVLFTLSLFLATYLRGFSYLHLLSLIVFSISIGLSGHTKTKWGVIVSVFITVTGFILRKLN